MSTLFDVPSGSRRGNQDVELRSAQFQGANLTQSPQYLRGTEGDDVGQFLFIPR